MIAHFSFTFVQTLLRFLNVLPIVWVSLETRKVENVYIIYFIFQIHHFKFHSTEWYYSQYRKRDWIKSNTKKEIHLSIIRMREFGLQWNTRASTFWYGHVKWTLMIYSIFPLFTDGLYPITKEAEIVAVFISIEL